MKKQELIRLKNKLVTYSLLSSLALIPSNINTLNAYAADYNNACVTDDNIKSERIEDLISYYSSVFQIKEEIVEKILMDQTRNFSSYEWNHHYIINNKSHDSVELAILDLTRNIYYNPEEYNYNSDEIKSDEEHDITMSPEEMIAKYSNLYGINKEIALAIVYTECGSSVNSSNYENNNNPAGLGPYMHFLNKEVGIIYFVNLLKNGYGCSIDSDESFLTRIASTYCEVPDHWLSLSLPFYNNLKDDYLYYKEDLKQEIDLSLYTKEKTNQKVKMN